VHLYNRALFDLDNFKRSEDPVFVFCWNGHRLHPFERLRRTNLLRAAKPVSFNIAVGRGVCRIRLPFCATWLTSNVVCGGPSHDFSATLQNLSPR
jgi:hypothetical protein